MNRLERSPRRRPTLGLLCTLLLAGAGGPARGQIPETFTNLQVLPKEVTRRELVGIMRGWAAALDVRCNHCHVGPDDLRGMDFATDEQPTKRAAREMHKMVLAINGGTLATLPPTDRPRQAVTCMTCHRGSARPPLPLDEELVEVARDRGAAAAVERYGTLRREHRDDGRYDFRPQVLTTAATRLAEDGKAEEALALARLGVEQHPDVARMHALLGLLLRRSDRAAAAVALRRALELDPQMDSARQALQELEAPVPP
jgi:hypothetical protein